MARAEYGTAKYQAKQLKALGLQKLRFYCQLCEKQCRDANGFKNHLGLPSHMGRISNLSKDGKAGSVVGQYLAAFERDFMRLLRINHGTKKISANKFYQEYILSDRDHVHMNATRWGSLTAFVRYLGQAGKVRVEMQDEDEFNLVIRLVDSAAPATEDREKSLQTDEERLMKFLEAQIAAGEQSGGVKEGEPSTDKEGEELLRDNEEPKPAGPVSLSLKGLKSKKPVAKRVFDL